jgi:hypothetical protein
MPWQKAFYSVLCTRFGEDDAVSILFEQRNCFAALYADRRIHRNRSLRVHLEEHILPGLALYKVLRQRGIGQYEALSITQVAMEEMTVSSRARMRWLGKLPFVFDVLRMMIRKVMQDNYPAAGWETEWVEVSSGLVAFNIHRCFYHQTLTEYGAPELTATFCALDDFIYKDVWPGVRWARTTTLGRGHALCNFRFERVQGGSSSH